MKSLILFSITIICFAMPARVSSQTFTTLYSFSATTTNATGVATNSDGASPFALVSSGDTLYGAAGSGGGLGSGAIFAIKTDGGGYTNLHNFAGSPNDGANPVNMVLSGNMLYGATSGGGNSGNGALFAIHTDGTGFTNYYEFPFSFPYGGSNGVNPSVGGLSSGNFLFGTARSGGNADSGTVFGLNTDGTGFTILHSFTYLPPPRPGRVNADGGTPNEVLLANDTLYGTTYTGGKGGSGTVYRINTNGADFGVLYAFTSPGAFGVYNGDGIQPNAVVLSGNTLYGTTYLGGTGGRGTVFAVNIDGTGFRTLHVFQGYPADDGGFPIARLTLVRNTLYGTTYPGYRGASTIFKVDTDGSGFVTLHTFSGTNEESAGELTLVGDTLYGTSTGGVGNSGEIFSLSLTPRLTINTSDTEAILTWPTNFTGYTLVTCTNIASQVWDTVPSTPSVVNGNYTVEIPGSGTPQFYRLKH